MMGEVFWKGEGEPLGAAVEDRWWVRFVGGTGGGVRVLEDRRGEGAGVRGHGPGGPMVGDL